MKMPIISNRKNHDFNLEHFESRLTARLGSVIVYMAQFIYRLISIFTNPTIQAKTQLLFMISLPFPVLVALIIGLEYFLFKKLGSKVAKYSSHVDLLLLLFFIGDWVIIVTSYTINGQHPFKISALFGFTTFSWRTLFATLIVQKWQLKIISPVVGILVAGGWAIYYTPEGKGFIVFNIVTQLFSVLMIVYCEDKVKWKLMWTNLQQEKWMQVNNFILNSIPENIMILDLGGQAKFISEYCKSFMKKCHLSFEETGDFSKKIRDLHKQEEDSESMVVKVTYYSFIELKK